MSVMERRLQILLDAARFDRVASEAERTGRSVAAVIREAIDLRFPDDEGAARGAAARALLTLTQDPVGEPGESPAQLKDAYAAALQDKVGAP